MRAPAFESRRAEYAALWASAVLRPETAPTVRASARSILSGRPRYDVVSKATGVPWYVIGLIHSMECSLSFRKCLHNGDPLVDREGNPAQTRRKPAGRGPFATWEDAAVDALRYDKLDKVRDWSIERIAYMLETFNGFGYVGRIPSPYLWSFTNHYERGKYERDGVWNPLLVSKQAGGMAILKALIEIDPTQVDLETRPVVLETVGDGFPKALPPKPDPQVVTAAKSTSVWMTLGSVALSVVAAVKAAVEWFGDLLATVFGGAIDTGAEAMKALPLIATDVETAIAPVRQLGTMIGANLGPILHAISLLMLVVVVCRHIKVKRELKVLKEQAAPVG